MLPNFKRTCLVRTDSAVIESSQITYIDISRIEDQIITIRIRGLSDPLLITGSAALELIWSLKPSVLEGKRLKWKKHAWVIHNLIGHPLMQIFAFIRLYGIAMWVHDVTIPKPKG